VTTRRPGRELSRRDILKAGLAASVGAHLAGSRRVVGAATPKSGGTLRIGTLQDTKSLNPLNQAGYPDVMLFPLAEGLVRIGAGNKVEPLLAERWENPNSLTYIFHLRSGVRFHNGRELTAEDVVASYEFVLSKDFTGAVLASAIQPVAQVEAVDARTVRMKLKYPFGPIMYVAHSVRILAKDAWAQVEQHPVGTGPFRFGEWVPKDHLRLVKFEQYWQQGLPRLDGVVFRITPDPQSGYLSFKAGDLDVALHDIMGPDNLLDARRVGKAQLIGPDLDPRFDLIYLDCAHPPTSDVRVRRAVAHLVDRDVMAKVVYEGLYPPAHTLFPPGHWAHSSQIRQLPYDPNRAKQLFDAAGVKELVFTTWTTRPQMRQMAEIIQEEASKIGVTIKVEALEPAKFLAKAAGTNKTFHMANSTSRRDYDPWFYLIYFMPPNDSNYDSPRLTELMKKQAGLSRIEERKALLDDVQRIAVQDVPQILVVYGRTLYAAQPFVQEFQVPFRGNEYELTQTWLDR
jgi:peptide/nickel transport system substrate-binding protein